MKSKLAASISPLSTAICKRFGGSTSSRSMISLFGSRNPQILCRSLGVEDESFSELGPETSHCSAKQIRLVTEKPEYFGKLDPSRKGLAGWSNSSDNMPKSKATVSASFRASPTFHPKPAEDSDSSLSPEYSSKISLMETARSITIKNICSTAGLFELVEAISVFGKVTGALFVNSSDGLKCCDIKFEFKGSNGRSRISSSSSSCGGVLAIRIKNISQNTYDHDIHIICKSLGELVGLSRMSKNSVNAFFNVWSDKVQLSILKRLNSTVTDGCVWSADILTNSSDEGGRCKLESRISDQMSQMRTQMLMDRINLEDLETLLFSVLYIQQQTPLSDAN